MPSFESTRLWRNALGSEPTDDAGQVVRERLRAGLRTFREKAAHLAAEIARDVPEYTVHDISHIDALWEQSDLISGDAVALTPTEAFVLGGAFLVHDLGNGLASYPDRLNELQRQPYWSDTLTLLLTKKLGRHPTSSELAAPDQEIRDEAIRQTLRYLHAEHAMHLLERSWKASENGSDYFLLDDPELRGCFASIIGMIAASHWWPVSFLRNRLHPAVLNSPAWCPETWTVDTLKLACLLRLADITHIDSRRAPEILRLARQPSGTSRDHWDFQAHLLRPRLVGDRLEFNTGRPFLVSEADAWFLCYDTLKAINDELLEVDNLLSDLGQPRLAARGVVGVDDPVRLTRLIPTEGWTPVDARVKVTNVAAIVSALGGEQLYGADLTVPVRELIQNGLDAVRARRILESRDKGWGSVTVRHGKDDSGEWIEVEDSGIGMSEDVICGALLDFGSSYWSTPLCLDEHPLLLTRGFQPIGKFGIGFFSIFMLGDRVRVTSRPHQAGQGDTKVLEFRSGLARRPVLRPATSDEYLLDGGTRVRVWLATDQGIGEILRRARWSRDSSLANLCTLLCPCVDVDLYVEDGGSHTLVVRANDWQDIDGETLLRRVALQETTGDQEVSYADLGKIVTPIVDREGNLVGRACVCPTSPGIHRIHRGVVTVGGIRSSGLSRIVGVLVGKPTVASRQQAIPIVDPETLSKWASVQAEMLPAALPHPKQLQDCAEIIRAAGGKLADLPVAESAMGWLRLDDIRRIYEDFTDILLVDDAFHNIESRKHKRLDLLRNVLAVPKGIAGVLQSSTGYRPGYSPKVLFWPTRLRGSSPLGDWWAFHQWSLCGAVVEALAQSWNVELGELISASSFSGDENRFVREYAQSDHGPVAGSVDIIRRP